MIPKVSFGSGYVINSNNELKTISKIEPESMKYSKIVTSNLLEPGDYFYGTNKTTDKTIRGIVAAKSPDGKIAVISTDNPFKYVKALKDSQGKELYKDLTVYGRLDVYSANN